MVCRTTNENEMGRFAKLLLRLPGENILIHHFCLTSWKSWDCNLRRSYGSAAQLPILKLSLCWTKLNQTLTQNSLPSFLLPNTACLTSWKSSCYIFLLAALRSIGLRCMEHLFFLRIVGEVSITSYSLITCSNKIYLFLKETSNFFLKSCVFQGNTSAIDSHLFDLLEAGQDWTEICDKSDRTKFQPREYCETRKLTLFSKFSIT